MKPNSSVAADLSKADSYSRICGQLSELMKGESDFLANAANTASLLFHSLSEVNWVGFYFLHSEQHLVLGPFQGKPACTRIKVGTGVCGTSAANRETVIVPDVKQFSGHIMCDSESKSEIVVPLLNWGRLIGVLDIDSPVLNRFDEEDRDGVESLVALFLSSFTSNDLPDFEALANNAMA
jgi:GAF domain-containing protein